MGAWHQHGLADWLSVVMWLSLWLASVQTQPSSIYWAQLSTVHLKTDRIQCQKCSVLNKNYQNCDSYINIPSSQTYRFYHPHNNATGQWQSSILFQHISYLRQHMVRVPKTRTWASYNVTCIYPIKEKTDKNETKHISRFAIYSMDSLCKENHWVCACTHILSYMDTGHIETNYISLCHNNLSVPFRLKRVQIITHEVGEVGDGCHMGWLSHVLYLRLQSSHGTEISFAVVF
jgi:hypothetical protein